jgi:hypothetical protein
MKSYMVLAAFSVFCVWLTDHLVDQQFEPPAYSKAEVRAINALVGRLTTTHVDKGVLFRPKNERERNEAIAYVFGED